MTVSLNTYRDIAGLGPNVRFKLDEQTELRSDGRRNIGNLFTRAWDCITRSDAQVESNKAIAKDFVQALRNEYGDEIANAMSRDLSAQLSKGRPLTGYRMQQVMEKAERMSDNIQANNRQLLNDCLPELTDSVLRKLGGDAQGLRREAVAHIVQQAIEQSPEFQQHGFKNALHIIMNEFGDDGTGLAMQEFTEHFQDLAHRAVEHRLLTSELAPELRAALRTGDLVTEHGAPRDVVARLGEHGFDEQDVAWMRGQGMSVGDTVMRFSPEQVALLKSQGLGIDLGLQYLDKGIPIHERTLVDDYRDERVVGEPRVLGGGQTSKPYEVTYGTDRMVYKEPGIDPDTLEEIGYGCAALKLGISSKHPQMTVRNIATKVIDEQLGFNLVPDTRIGVLNGKVGMVMGYVEGITSRYNVPVDLTKDAWSRMQGYFPDLRQALKDGDPEMTREFKTILLAMQCRYEPGPFDVSDDEIGQRILELSRSTPQDQQQAQELLDGLPGSIDENGRVIQELRIMGSEQRGNRDVDLDDPIVRRGLVQLQLLDALTAQGDRHQLNYIFTLDGDGRHTGVKAIDNDQAFGTKIKNPNDLLHKPQGKDTVMGPDGVDRWGDTDLNGVMLPGVVDRDMKNAFDRITPDGLRAALAGLLPEPEIEAAVDRLDVIKTHLAKLELEGKIIENDQWGSEFATQALLDENTSYVGRDKQYIGKLLREEEERNQRLIQDQV
jgi:hypothetical protein